MFVSLLQLSRRHDYPAEGGGEEAVAAVSERDSRQAMLQRAQAA